MPAIKTLSECLQSYFLLGSLQIINSLTAIFSKLKKKGQHTKACFVHSLKHINTNYHFKFTRQKNQDGFT